MYGQLTDGFCLAKENMVLFVQVFMKTARFNPLLEAKMHFCRGKLCDTLFQNILVLIKKVD